MGKKMAKLQVNYFYENNLTVTNKIIYKNFHEPYTSNKLSLHVYVHTRTYVRTYVCICSR